MSKYTDEQLAANDIYVNGLDNPLMTISDHLASDDFEQAIRVALLVIKQRKQRELDAFKAGMSEAACLVETHWNDQNMKVNQYEQALRSRDAILTARDNKTEI